MPNDEFGFLHQGTCLINLGRFEDAISILEKAEEVASPESQYMPDIFQELAFAYSELHQPDTAIYYLDKTDNLDCDHINIQIIRGHVYLANKRQKEAESTFRKALVDSGNSPKVMLRIIVSLYDNQYLRASYMLLKSFFKYMDDDWKDGYAYMALCCLDMKKDDEFLHYLKLACEKNPKEARTVLGSYFPKGTEPKDYYDYMINKLSKK
jgi:tetratricopeptide (TPR) repeat protein